MTPPEFCTGSEHVGTCAKCVYAENVELRTDLARLQAELDAKEGNIQSLLDRTIRAERERERLRAENSSLHSALSESLKALEEICDRDEHAGNGEDCIKCIAERGRMRAALKTPPIGDSPSPTPPSDPKGGT